MGLEIEHKFLLKNDTWRNEVSHSVHYKQGYLCSTTQNSVRVRVSSDRAWINIKSATTGSHRQEFEYPIPIAEAHEMLETLCHKPLIEKYRHFLPRGPHTWEIDEFLGDNHGLIVAEIELNLIDERFDKPDWLAQEVTDNLRYYNNNLCKNPYKDWQ